MLNYDKSRFERIFRDSSNEREILVHNASFFQDTLKRFKKNKGAVVGLIVITIVLFFSLIGPFMNSYKYDQVMTEYEKLPPRIPIVEKLGILDGTIVETKTKARAKINPDYERIVKEYVVNGKEMVDVERNIYKQKGFDDIYFWFGTDTLGRDQWTRVWTGTRVSFYIAFLAVLIDMVIGITYGMISGYKGGRTDTIMQRVVEIIVGIPRLVIVTLLVLVLNPGLMSITLALIITGWIGMSRVVRSQVLKLKSFEFILASRTLGSSDSQIIIKDILPNIFGQVLVMSMFSVPSAIFYESFLAFIGLGLQPPMASLGVLISDGYKSIMVYPHMLLYPVVILALLMLTFNLLADGLRDALDPKMKEE
ncbi:ABC transporter permease [Mycoplasmatota bacterium zrk1]